MKLPKNFGGQGFAGMLQQAQSAMARAQELEQELAAERFEVNKDKVKAIFNGTGELMAIKIDKSIVDPEDIEGLEDLVVSTIREGFAQATEIRNAKVQEIIPHVPGL
jgi:nucleoid-associated protein EbfC